MTIGARWTRALVGAAHSKSVHSRRVGVLANHFAEMIPAQHCVLDVGCGDGLIDALLAQRRPDLQLAGVDVLVRPNARIPVTPFDGLRLPYKDRSWDTVLFCDALHHAADPVALLREAARVARQSVVIKDHSVQGVLAWHTLRFMDYVGNAPHGVALPYTYLTPQQWQDAFAASSLRPENVRTELGIYPRWANPIFGRSLHFIAACGILEREG